MEKNVEDRDPYEVAEQIVVRHGLRQIPGNLLARCVWTADDIIRATGLNAAEVAELRRTCSIRQLGGGVTLRDDILDLLGVRSALDNDTKASYLERCHVVGVNPDPCNLHRLVDSADVRTQGPEDSPDPSASFLLDGVGESLPGETIWQYLSRCREAGVTPSEPWGSFERRHKQNQLVAAYHLRRNASVKDMQPQIVLGLHEALTMNGMDIERVVEILLADPYLADMDLFSACEGAQEGPLGAIYDCLLGREPRNARVASS